MKNKTPDQKLIENDIMRYKKNKWAQMLALLGIVFNCLYFTLLYAQRGNTYKTVEIGVSVVLTLVILLTVFLSSENVKNYRKKYSIVLLVIAAIQILRIFGYPLDGLNNHTLTAGYFGFYPTPEQSWVEFVILTVYLCASAGCLIGSAVIGWIRALQYENYLKKIESGEIDVMATIRKMDAEDEAAKAEADAQPTETVEEVQ